jgi:hypothetical protein
MRVTGFWCQLIMQMTSGCYSVQQSLPGSSFNKIYVTRLIALVCP